MRTSWTKAELTNALIGAQENVRNSDHYLAIDHALKLVLRLYEDKGHHEILGEEIVNGRRLDAPSVGNDAVF